MLTQLALWAASFLAAAMAVGAAGRAFSAVLGRHPDLERLDRGGGGPDSRTISALATRSWGLAIELAAREVPSEGGSFYRRLARDLVRSAARSEITPQIFLGQALVEGALLFFALGMLASGLFGQPFVFLALGVGVFHALVLRPHLLRARADERVAQIHRQLPYAIDLLILILGAGGTLREGLALVAEKAQSDPLADEVAQALTRIRAGTAQPKALEEMAQRVGLEDLSSLVIAVNRGEATGAPMAKTLQAQAEIFRFRRLQRAERLAVEAPVKMMFPNMVIMLAVLLIVIGPVLLNLLNQSLF